MVGFFTKTGILAASFPECSTMCLQLSGKLFVDSGFFNRGTLKLDAFVTMVDMDNITCTPTIFLFESGLFSD